jgi:adenosylmethionine-8-amino-7-oxononanoate aminotransferase
MVRCTGLLSAVELSADLRAAHPILAERFAMKLRSNGVMTRVLMGHSLQISPSLVIGEEEIRFMADAFSKTLDQVAQEIRITA